jgi:hypothetical protein
MTKPMSTFGKVVLALVLIIATSWGYGEYKTRKISAQYVEALSDTCKKATVGIEGAYDALSSPGLTYVERLRATRSAQRDFAAAERILGIGLEGLDRGTLLQGTIGYSLYTSELERLIEFSLDDLMDIAIAQGDPESIADGQAYEGFSILQDRVSQVQEICSKYK